MRLRIGRLLCTIEATPRNNPPAIGSPMPGGLSRYELVGREYHSRTRTAILTYRKR